MAHLTSTRLYIALLGTLSAGGLGLVVALRSPDAELASSQRVAANSSTEVASASAPSAVQALPEPAIALPRDAAPPAVAPPGVLLARTIGQPLAIAVDATFVYWTSGQTLAKVPKRGGDPTVLARSAGLADVAAEGGAVYWLDGQRVLALAKGSSQPVRVDLGATELPEGLALDADWLYWSSTALRAYFVRAPKILAGETFCAPDPAWGARPVGEPAEVIGVDRAWVYGWTMDEHSSPSGALRGSRVIKLAKGTIRAKPVVMASGLMTRARPVVRGESIYFGDVVAGAIVRVDEPTQAHTVLATGQVGPGSVLVDEHAIFWSDGEGLVRAPLAGGATTRLAAERGIWRLAQDSTHVYWLSAATIGRVPKGAP